MRFLLSLVASIGVFFGIAGTAFAYGQLPPSTITTISTNNAGLVFVSFSNNLTNRPACSAGTGQYQANALTIDATTDIGRAILSQATAAFLSGTSLTAGGTGACTHSSTTEDILYINLYH